MNACTDIGIALLVGMVLGLILFPIDGHGQDDTPLKNPSVSVTSEMVHAKIAEVEIDPALSAELKESTLQSLHRSLSSIEQIRTNEEKAKEYRESIELIPAELENIRRQTQELLTGAADGALDFADSASIEQIEQQSIKQQADLAVASARRDELTKQISFIQARPQTISQRLPAARQEQDEILAQYNALSNSRTAAVEEQARRWELETKYVELSTEISLLDQELLSQPLRLDLLNARLEQEKIAINRLQSSVDALTDRLNEEKQLAAAVAQSKAAQAEREIAGIDPLLVELAQQNSALGNELETYAAQLDTLKKERVLAAEQAAKVTSDVIEAENILTKIRSAEGLGVLLWEYRRSLLDIGEYEIRSGERQKSIARINVGQLNHRKEMRRLVDFDGAYEDYRQRLSAPEDAILQEKLNQLLRQRVKMLDQVIQEQAFFLDQLQGVDQAEQELISAVRRYRELVDGYLLWLRTGPPATVQDLDDAIAYVKDYIKDRPPLLETLSALAATALGSVRFWLVGGLACVLFLLRTRFTGRIETMASTVNRLTLDRFSSTFYTFFYTILLVAPLPLVLFAFGWSWQTSWPAPGWQHALGVALSWVALHASSLIFFIMITRPGGLAPVHFRWPKRTCTVFRNALLWFAPIYLIGFLLRTLIVAVDPSEFNSTAFKFVQLIVFGASSLFFLRILRPKDGVFTHFLGATEKHIFLRSYYLWYGLLVSLPLFVIFLSFSGYTYTSYMVALNIRDSLWLFLGLILIHCLVLRWLRLVRGQLALNEARQRMAQRHAERERAGGDRDSLLSDEIEAPRLDLVSMGADTRALISTAAIISGVIGMYMIWADMLPALGIFNKITLWQYTTTVGTEEVVAATTLSDVFTAFIILVVTMILARRLPVLIEIIILRRFDVASGDRYTIKTICTYIVFAVGLILTLNFIGLNWSKLQWLVAALGVGIGFGLQEIVANFISGLIILFERPIRVGDIVTVGDTDGMVTKIQIRATTIRNYDRKELLVPNKEFITGRLLNWSLSDNVIRIIVRVGVAYGSDVEKALKLLREAAAGLEHIVDEPPPIVTFQSFGDNALGLTLRVYISSVDYRLFVTTELHRRINESFNKAGIVIAFPQRDIHLDTARPLEVNISRNRTTGGEKNSGE